MRKKKLPQIEIRTVRNGYTMHIGGHRQDYLFFSPEKLLEGFMLHVGLKMTDQLDRDTMQRFIQSALEWNENEKCVKEIQRLNRELSAMRNKRNQLARMLIRERDEYINLRDGVQLIHTNADSPNSETLLKDIATKYLVQCHKRKKLTLGMLDIDSDAVVLDETDNEDDDEEEDK